ncbi:SDR family oxidoreductase [Nocardiopsis nanhaiensis]
MQKAAGETPLVHNRIAVVTGAATGIGRAHAHALAAAGARTVVNDIDGRVHDVVEEIGEAGGTAIAAAGDIADWDFAAHLVTKAVSTFGGLDVLVNNAGMVCDRMIVSMAEEEWDRVLRVDLKGHFAPLRHAAAYWRERSKAGEQVRARVVNTTSGAGLQGSVGQANYSAAKAGVASLTQVAAAELARYGVTVNAIAPAARTAMTATVFADDMKAPDTGFDAMDPGNVTPLVVWLAGEESAGVTGRVFEVWGDEIAVAQPWLHGTPARKGGRWDPAELGPVVTRLVEVAPAPEAVYGG